MLDSVASLKNAGPADLTYAEEKFQDEARSSKAGCILVKSGDFPGQNVIVVRNPKLAFALAAGRLLMRRRREPRPSIRHGGSDVEIGSNVRVGPGAVVEPVRSSATDPSSKQAFTIGADARIGKDCRIYPRVTIYPNVEIGKQRDYPCRRRHRRGRIRFRPRPRPIREVPPGGQSDHRRRRGDRREHLHRPRFSGNHDDPARHETRQSHSDRA